MVSRCAYHLFGHVLECLARRGAGVELFNSHACIPKTSFRIFFPTSYHTDTPLEIRSYLFVRAALKLMPLLLNKSLQLGEELLDQVEVQGVRWMIRSRFAVQF